MRPTSNIKGFLRAEDGTVLALWVMGLAAFLGIVALTFDIGRVGITRSELQSFADNVALAAAAELDGNSDAITRANLAASTLITDTRTFGAGDLSLSGDTDYTLTFLSALPASDLTSLGANVTTDPALAKFARVEATPASVSMIFLRAVNSLLGNGTAAIDALVLAEAVAGFTWEACDITPLMFCLPENALGNVLDLSDPINIGMMIRLRSGGQGAAWGPGAFEFLDPSKSDLGATCAGLNGVNLTACLVGAELGITQCFTQNGVDIEPGQKVGIEDAIFNVRFDIYKSIMSGEKNDERYPPAPNVISGLVPKGGGSCIGQNDESSPDSIGLPRDTCFADGSCPFERVGDGVWDSQNYLDWNYGTLVADADGNFTPTLNSGSDAHLPAIPASPYDVQAGTRYAMYLREIEYSKSLALPGGAILSGRAETGLPQCAPAENVSIHPERRVVIAAGINCNENPINGAQTNVPVTEFFALFLTEPVGDDGSASPPTLDIWVENLGSASGDGPGDGGLIRDLVQLYR